MKEKKEAKLYHALIPVAVMAVIMFAAVVLFDSTPHIPLVLGCLTAGLVAVRLGYNWNEILEGMIEGITDSLEAILILLLIGMLVGSWIAAGTVPTMIYYGLKIVSPGIFLPATMLICLLVAFTIGSWGTVGTIGLAFLGIGLALDIPAPLTAGAVISGAYMGEVVSPLSDATNLAAAVVGENVLRIVRRILPAALTGGLISLALYTLYGLRFAGGSTGVVESSIHPLLEGLRGHFRITPAALLPMALVVVCILRRLPAIPSMLAGGLFGMLQGLFLQGLTAGDVFTYAYFGYVSRTGHEMLDTLLSAGGMEGMLEPISVILIAMAFGGIMKKTRQMEALVRPVISRLRTAGGMGALTVLSCVFMNAVLPDQYLGISMPGQMYGQAYDERGMSRSRLGATLLGGGAVTSPLIPWNTCGIYCMSILAVRPAAYAPYAFYGMILPVVTIAAGFVSGKRAERRS